MGGSVDTIQVVIYRRIGRGATEHSTASHWLTLTRNSGSLDTGTVALNQRDIQASRICSKALHFTTQSSWTGSGW